MARKIIKTKKYSIMKKYFFMFASVGVMMLTACDDNKSNEGPLTDMRIDSLEQIIMQKDAEIDDIMGTFNDIQEGFRLINEAEGRISVAQAGEGADIRQQLKENVVYISQKMAQNRELISKLRQQLKESTLKGEQLNRTIEELIRQLEEKDRQLQQLREELDAKDIHISELDETISNLNSDVTTLKTESAQKSQTIASQDKQLHTAWYAFGTKKELKERNVLRDGKVQVDNLSKSYFTKIDIRTEKEIKLYSKSAKLLTVHPSGSYTLTPDSKGQYVLKISNPDQFWSSSKYLVLQVK